ncbi:MAG: DUF2914 domain-containing protein [Bdellovibrionota bacterium]
MYHNIERKGDVYELSYTRPIWRFWESGDQTFIYRPGDRVHIFTSVFAPSNLKHRIQIRWETQDRFGGWQTTDVIPIAINGGREEGYRGVANKQNVQPGKWRVRIETEDGRELRRLKFRIIPDENPEEIREAHRKKLKKLGNNSLRKFFLHRADLSYSQRNDKYMSFKVI